MPTKNPAKRKRSANRKKQRPATVHAHLLRMASAPMPDDFGTQLATYMNKLGKKSTRRRTRKT